MSFLSRKASDQFGAWFMPQHKISSSMYRFLSVIIFLVNSFAIFFMLISGTCLVFFFFSSLYTRKKSSTFYWLWHALGCVNVQKIKFYCEFETQIAMLFFGGEKNGKNWFEENWKWWKVRASYWKIMTSMILFKHLTYQQFKWVWNVANLMKKEEKTKCLIRKHERNYNLAMNLGLTRTFKPFMLESGRSQVNGKADNEISLDQVLITALMLLTRKKRDNTDFNS